MKKKAKEKMDMVKTRIIICIVQVKEQSFNAYPSINLIEKFHQKKILIEKLFLMNMIENLLNVNFVDIYLSN